MKDQSSRSLAFSQSQLAMFPELRYFVEEQAPAEGVQVYLDFHRGRPWIMLIVFAGLVSPALAILLRRGLGFGVVAIVAVVVVVQVLVTWAWLGMMVPAVQRRRIRAALRERLKESGILACRRCAYDMRDARCVPRMRGTGRSRRTTAAVGRLIVRRPRARVEPATVERWPTPPSPSTPRTRTPPSQRGVGGRTSM